MLLDPVILQQPLHGVCNAPTIGGLLLRVWWLFGWKDGSSCLGLGDCLWEELEGQVLDAIQVGAASGAQGSTATAALLVEADGVQGMDEAVA